MVSGRPIPGCKRGVQQALLVASMAKAMTRPVEMVSRPSSLQSLLR
jgi:hypothetical protein